MDYALYIKVFFYYVENLLFCLKQPVVTNEIFPLEFANKYRINFLFQKLLSKENIDNYQLNQIIVLKMINRKYKQLEIISEIQTILRKNNINSLVVKGIPQEYIVYGDIQSRNIGDIDVFVSQKDFQKSYRVLRENGYKQPFNDSFIPQLASPFDWEIFIEKEKNESIELKFGLSELRTKVDFLWDYTQEITVNNTRIITLNNSATLALLYANLHKHLLGRDSMYSDYVRLLMDYLFSLNEQINFYELFEISQKLEIVHKIYELYLNLKKHIHFSQSQKEGFELFNPLNAKYIMELDGYKSDKPMNGGLLFSSEDSDNIFNSNDNYKRYRKCLKNAILNGLNEKDFFYIKKQGEIIIKNIGVIIGVNVIDRYLYLKVTHLNHNGNKYKIFWEEQETGIVPGNYIYIYDNIVYDNKIIEVSGDNMTTDEQTICLYETLRNDYKCIVDSLEQDSNLIKMYIIDRMVIKSENAKFLLFKITKFNEEYKDGISSIYIKIEI